MWFNSVDFRIATEAEKFPYKNKFVEPRGFTNQEVRIAMNGSK